MLKKKPTEGEIISTRQPADLAGYGVRNLTPSRLSAILAALDAGDVADAMALFDEMNEKDLHLGAVTQTRVLSVVSRDRSVVPASSDAEEVQIAKFVGEVFDAIPRRREALCHLMSAITHGFAVAEIVWEVNAGMVRVKEFLPRPQRLFSFIDPDDTSCLLDFPAWVNQETGQSVKIPREKFVYHKNFMGNGNPLKGGLYRGISWYYFFTNFTMKDWLTFMDVYGIPLRLGRYNSATDENSRATLKKAVANLGSDAAAIISDDTTIEFIQAAISGNHSLFREAVEHFNRQKSKRVLGQTLTTESSEKGSYSLGKIHDAVRGDIVAFDAMALDETLTNDLVRPLVEFNFGPRKRFPKIVTNLSGAGEASAKLEQVKKLVELGAKIPARHVAEITGVPMLGDLDAPFTYGEEL